MDEVEVHKVMTFLNAEAREQITSERRAVWTEMLKDVSYEHGFLAAKILVARSNKFAGLNEFLKSVAEVSTPPEERETWGEAWDKWVKVAGRTGYYRMQEAAELYAKESPRGAQVMSTCMKEWFLLQTEDVQIFRAQFRQRYEALAAKANHQRVLPKEIQIALGYVPSCDRTLPSPAGFTSTGQVLQKLIGGKK